MPRVASTARHSRSVGVLSRVPSLDFLRRALRGLESFAVVISSVISKRILMRV
jgi:hypothetical protein